MMSSPSWLWPPRQDPVLTLAPVAQAKQEDYAETTIKENNVTDLVLPVDGVTANTGAADIDDILWPR